MDGFRMELTNLINKHSMENGSDTPDFILAQYLGNCLAAYDAAVKHREEWYGREVGGWAQAEGSKPDTERGETPPRP